MIVRQVSAATSQAGRKLAFLLTLLLVAERAAVARHLVQALAAAQLTLLLLLAALLRHLSHHLSLLLRLLLTYLGLLHQSHRQLRVLLRQRRNTLSAQALLILD